MNDKFDLYSKNSRYVLGFHGCNEDVANKLLNNNTPTFKQSNNSYDWLGQGMYFWENDPLRAESFILETQKRNPSKINKPTVIGAVLDLGHCFNLTDYKFINILKEFYPNFIKVYKELGLEIPQNNKTHKSDHDKLLRHLDCAVIQFLFFTLEQQKKEYTFDSVRAMFIEGSPIYDGAGFHEKTHVQIAIRNPNMIKGYFRPIYKHKEI